MTRSAWPGPAYLIYLGVRLLRTRGFSLQSVEEDAGHPSGVTPGRAFGEGFLSDLANPKTVLVYASVIPQFLTVSSSGSDAFVLGVVFAVLGFVSLTVYALVFGAARTRLSKGRVMRNVLRGSGGILVFFGIALLVERRLTECPTGRPRPDLPQSGERSYTSHGKE